MRRATNDAPSAEKLSLIRQHAFSAIKKADALGRFPTQVSDIMAASKVLVVAKPDIDEGFLKKMRASAGRALKSALSKVLGVFDAKARTAYVDQTVLTVRQAFLKLHEAGHAVLPWQKDAYLLVEDCEKTISPEISEQFDSEANSFASEVLFQLDAFTEEARDMEFGIRAPLSLSKKYGASVYASIRRYVSTNYRTCAVLVLNPPTLKEVEGFSVDVRRVIASPSFEQIFGDIDWPEVLGPGDELGKIVPVGRAMSRPRSIGLIDANGDLKECVGEAFNGKFYIFILVHVTGAPAGVSIVGS